MPGRITICAAVVSLFLLLGTALAQSQTAPQPSPAPAQMPTCKADGPSQKQPGEDVDDDVIRVTTNLVTSNALVIGRDRKYAPTLRREDFHVFEDDVEQPLSYFAAIDRPFDVVLVLDNSRSTSFELRYIKEAAIAFVNHMRPADRALVVSLTDDFKTMGEPSDNHGVLRQAIYNVKSGGATSLYDAVDFAINHTLSGSQGRKAVILLTDGVDNDSRYASYQSNLNDVVSSGVQVYAVQFSTHEKAFKQAARIRRPPPEGSGFSPVDYQRADAYLHQIADLSGTAVYPAATSTDLDSAVAGIAEELHNEYTLGYYPRSPGCPGEVRRLEVRVSQPWLVVRSRTAYSFGPAATVKSDRSSVAAATLSEIESSSPFRTIVEDKKPLDARWVCKSPFVPGDYALVQEGFDAKCPPSTRSNDQTNAWLIRKPGASEIVCKGFLSWNGSEIQIAPIPSGYAVVGEVRSSVCSQSNDPKSPANAWSINRPSSEETVCKGFLIPHGFVVVNERKQAACPTTSREANAWVIVPKWDIERRRFWSEP